MQDVYNNTIWAELDYADPTSFITRREILFFLNEELGLKFPKLNGQIHAGWKHTLDTPITMAQLMDRPDVIDTVFTDEEEKWFTESMKFLVSSMDKGQQEDLGITMST